jgi:3',5'-cyclic AMP phosphodiesterase CpdA
MKRTILTLIFSFLSLSAGFLKLPYLQNVTDSTIYVCWEGSDSVAGQVFFGLTPAKEQVVVDSNRTLRHEVLLSRLLPDTIYYYQVIAGIDTSPEGFFRTPAPALNCFRFAVYGDNRTDSVAHQAVVDRMCQVSPLPVVLFNVGDLTANSTAGEYLTFFNIARNLLRFQPLFPVIGNHDNRNIGNYLLNFVLPGNERYYSVLYGNCAFIIVDNYTDFSVGSEQYRWLETELIHYSTSPGIRHIFVIFHEPPYTTSLNHSGNQAVQEFLCPLFEQYQVRAVFCGHIHAYEHSLVNNIHYFTTGGGGAPLYTGWRDPEPWTVYREAVYQFMLIDVSGDTVLLRGVRTDGSEFDSTLLFNLNGIEEQKGAVLISPVSAFPVLTRGKINITFNITQPGLVKLTIYDPAGKKVLTPVNKFLNTGVHNLHFELNRRGSYFAICHLNNRISFSRFIRL